MANLQTPLLDKATPETPGTPGTPGTPESHASSSSWTLVNDLVQQLREVLEKWFLDTRVLEDEPTFFDEVLKAAVQIILTHCCLVLGPAGAGKTSLVKALAEDFEPNVEPGPGNENRTEEAQGVDLKLENLIENLKVVLIDTPGWSQDTSTNVKKEYKKILKERQLVSEHTPHIILLLIPCSGLRQFQDREAKKMSKQLQELKFDQRFPIKVLPVATKADCEKDCNIKKILSDIKILAEEAFSGTGAEVEDAVCTMLPPKGQPDGVAQVKACLSAMLSKQINSPKFEGLWQKAFAKSLADHTREHCLQFPENDSACRLFKRAYRTVEAICKKEAADLPKIASQDAEELPWWSIAGIAETNAASWSAFCTTFLSWWEGWHSYQSMAVMLLSVPSCVLQSPRSDWDVRRLRSSRILRRGLSFLLVLLLLAFSWDHHFNLEVNQKLQDEKQKFENEEQMLQDENQKLQDEKQKFENEEQMLQDENQKLQDEKQKFENEKQMLQDENQKLQDEKQKFENEKQMLEDENQKLQIEKWKPVCYFDLAVTGQCYGLEEAPFISSAEACQEFCCTAGSDDCTTWQYQSVSGCFVGIPDSCHENDGSWNGGQLEL